MDIEVNLHESLLISIPENNLFKEATVRLTFDESGLIARIYNGAGPAEGATPVIGCHLALVKRPEVEAQEVEGLGLALVNDGALYKKLCDASPLTRHALREVIVDHHGVCRNATVLRHVVAYVADYFKTVSDVGVIVL